MIGQLTDEQFKEKIQAAGFLRSRVDYVNKTAWIMYGKATTNYYQQHRDGSWTNYDCKTSY